MPFTQQQFLEIFATYNAAMWPAQIIAYGAGLMVFIALFWPGLSRRGRWIMTVLAAFWAVNGVAYHGLFFSTINPLAFGFAALFIIASGWFFLDGTLRNRVRFAFNRSSVYCWIGIGVMVYAMAGYPFTNFLAGHVYPVIPTFGLTPCPTTKFTLGVLLLATTPNVRYLAVIPVLWSLVGGTAAIFLGIPEDWPLLFLGPMIAILLWLKFRNSTG